MDSYEEVENKCNELKMYTKRVMDLYCDSKKWKWMADMTTDSIVKQKYMDISNSLMTLFNKEVENMKA